MAHVTRIIVIAVLFCAWSGTSAQDECCNSFGFGEEQETEWGKCWPTCDGENQSPIDIQTDDVTIQDLPSVTGPFYDHRTIPFYFNITNENYTVTVQLLEAETLYLEGGPLGGRYKLEHMQFCWGSDSTRGSDHTFNGESYPLETQWGLYSDIYGSYEEALGYPGGVLRISQLHPIQEYENPSFVPIVRILDSVIEPGDSATSDETLTYDNIFSGYPPDDYYHYNGSFTSPPCSETVKWLVFPPLNGISEDQLEAFRKLQSTDGPLVNNFRLPQPLNGRTVVQSNKSSACVWGCDTRAKSSRHHGKESRSVGASKRHGVGIRQGKESRGVGAQKRQLASKDRGAARRRHH